MFLSCLLTVGQDTAPTDRTVKKRRWTVFYFFLFSFWVRFSSPTISKLRCTKGGTMRLYLVYLVNSKAPGSCLGLFLWMYEWMCRQEMQRSSCLWKNKQHWSSIWSTNHPTHFLFPFLVHFHPISNVFLSLEHTHCICIIQSCLHLFECLWVAEGDRQGWCHCYLNVCDSLLCTMDFCQSGHPGTKWPWIVVF